MIIPTRNTLHEKAHQYFSKNEIEKAEKAFDKRETGRGERLKRKAEKSSVMRAIVGFIAGRSAPSGKRMGHAGAIISSGDSTAEAKREVLKAAGVKVVDFPDEIPAAF